MAKILLIGDSLTERIPPNLIGEQSDEVINQGISNIGVGTYHQYVWPKVYESDIDIVIFLLGLNNILRPDCDYDNLETIDDTIEKIKKFINEITKTDSRLILQSLYPTRNANINELIQYVNEKILEHCYHIDIEYLEMYDLLTDKEGLLKNEYTIDGIHFNENGVSLIANQINDFLQTIKEK